MLKFLFTNSSKLATTRSVQIHGNVKFKLVKNIAVNYNSDKNLFV